MQKLFAPCRLGPFSLRNPLVLLPFFMSYADDKGCVTPTVLRHYQKMAASGVGLLVVEAALIRHCDTPYSIGVSAPEHLSGLKELAQTIQAEGAKAVLQICHPGRYSRSPGALAPSEVAPFGNQEYAPKAMTEEDMRSVAADFVFAAALVKEAGFDGVELHGGTGYLLASYISPHTNRRNDKYGGSLENRLRFPLMVCEAVKNAVGEFPVGYRFMSREYFEGGLTIEEGAQAAAILEQTLKPAYFSVTAGQYECFALMEQSKQKAPEGFMLDEAKAVKNALKDTPVIAAGHMQSGGVCEKALAEGIDAVGLGRPLLADPDWLRKVSGQTPSEVRNCVQCNTCQKQAGLNSPVFCARWSKEEKAERFEGLPPQRVQNRTEQAS